jgi:hypothetical protein
MIGEIHIGDAGLPFIKTMYDQNGAILPVDGTSARQFVFERPNGTCFIKSAVFVTDGKDGKLKYLTESADLDMAGLWKWQVILTWGTVVLYSDITIFRVFPNI